ncbi:SUF system Fe-S cluster assembly protein [bacterium]|nr:SUF system Fe-S cluster assembly protein [bacterium]
MEYQNDNPDLHESIVNAMRTIYDPEIPVNIYDLGLIYEIDPQDDGRVIIKMTLTAPNCPVAEYLPIQVKSMAESVPGVTEAIVDVVWDPPWNRDMMSEAAKLDLGLM